MPHASRDTTAGSIIMLALPIGAIQFRRLGDLPASSIEFQIGDPTATNTAGRGHIAPPEQSPNYHDGTQSVELGPAEPLGEANGLVLANSYRNQLPVQPAGGR